MVDERERGLNYSDFPDLQVDEFCGTRFGPSNQLEVVGKSGKMPNTRVIRYVVLCHLCRLDSELNGDAVYPLSRVSIVKHRTTPCGCSQTARWTSEQYAVRLKRALQGSKYTFVELDTPFKGNVTKARCWCPIHGDWGATVQNILAGRRCPHCKAKVLKDVNTKTSEEHIEEIFSTGRFAPGTTFTRKETRNQKGRIVLRWIVYCPVCDKTYTSISGNLKKGRVGCDCKSTRAWKQKLAYIAAVGGYLKFGIAQDVRHRHHVLAKNTGLSVVPLSTWEFDDSVNCIAAERECKRTLDCSIVPKADMPDGYTETTYLYNIPAIEAIYKKHGGVRL